MKWPRLSALAIVLVLAISFTFLIEVEGQGPTVDDIFLIVYDYVNNSKAVVGAQLSYTGNPPSKLDNVTFRWFDPKGELVNTMTSDPDDIGFARSDLTVTTPGMWSVNASYTQDATVFYDNKTFEVVKELWEPAVYVLPRTLIVGETTSLTISPGAVLRFESNASLTVKGRLLSRGEWNNTITFTSNKSSPGKNDWAGLEFMNGSGSSVFEYGTVEFAKNGIDIENASPSILNSTFLNNTRGLKLVQSNSSVVNNTFSRNNEGIHALASSPLLKNNTITHNTFGVSLLFSTPVLLEENIVEDNDQSGISSASSSLHSLRDGLRGNPVGMRLDNSTIEGESLLLTDNDEGVECLSCRGIIFNSTIDSRSSDFYLGENSHISIVNSIFYGKVSGEPGCSDCWLYVGNFLSVKAMDHANFSVLEGVSVYIFDEGNLCYAGLTDSEGMVRDVIVVDRTYLGGSLRENRTTVLLAFEGIAFENNNRSIAMNESHLEVFLSGHSDYDGDGEPDFSDTDDDNDGLSDDTETQIGSDPLNNDTDGDGMPDGWEFDHGLSPLDEKDRDEDMDKDGFTNYEEYLNSTDPSDANSHPPVQQGAEEGVNFTLLLLMVVAVSMAALLLALSVVLWRKILKSKPKE